jgi:hypothetical protein
VEGCGHASQLFLELFDLSPDTLLQLVFSHHQLCKLGEEAGGCSLPLWRCSSWPIYVVLTALACVCSEDVVILVCIGLRDWVYRSRCALSAFLFSASGTKKQPIIQVTEDTHIDNI